MPTVSVVRDETTSIDATLFCGSERPLNRGRIGCLDPFCATPCLRRKQSSEGMSLTFYDVYADECEYPFETGEHTDVREVEGASALLNSDANLPP